MSATFARAVARGALPGAISTALVVLPVAGGIAQSTSSPYLWRTVWVSALVGACAGTYVAVRHPSSAQLMVVGPLTVAAVFSALYPISLFIGVLISSVENDGFSWGNGPVMAIVTVSVAAVVPVAACFDARWRWALVPLACVTAVVAVLSLPLYGIGFVLLPLAVSQWAMIRTRSSPRAIATRAERRARHAALAQQYARDRLP